MDATGGIPFPFDTYSTDLGGATLGKVYEDHSAGKRYQLVRISQTISGASTIPINAPVLVSGAGTSGTTLGFIVTDKVSDGLDVTNPIGAGVITSAAPKSTTSTTYYAWSQVAGLHTAVKKDGNAIAVGDIVVQSGATDGVATASADGTAITGALEKSIIGLCAVAALAGDATVSLRIGNQFI